MTAILTPFECGSFTKLFSKDRANKYFQKGIVVFFAGGTGHPYFSTDTGVVLRAVEVDADVILLAKSIDGVYDDDPSRNPAAKKYDEVSIDEVIAKNLQVVDMTASILARDNKMPMWDAFIKKPVMASSPPNGGSIWLGWTMKILKQLQSASGCFTLLRIPIL